MDHATCRHPDRDVPKLMCGYPLPCPWHTAIIDTSKDPATITVPLTSDATKHLGRLGDIARAVEPTKAERVVQQARRSRRKK